MLAHMQVLHAGFESNECSNTCLWRSPTRKNRWDLSPEIVTASTTEITYFRDVWTTRIFLGTQTPDCLKLPHPTSLAVLMRRIFSECFLYVSSITNNSIDKIQTQNAFLVLYQPFDKQFRISQLIYQDKALTFQTNL